MFLLLLGNGFEEIEALGTLDLMRRAEIDVKTCTVNRTPLVLGAHHIAVEADLCLSELANPPAFDGLILPGGMGGVEALAATPAVLEMVKACVDSGKLLAAICAAPAVVLTAAGVAEGRKLAGYPAPALIERLGEGYTPEAVAVDGAVISAKGPGSVFAFAKAIITFIKGLETAEAVMTEAIASA